MLPKPSSLAALPPTIKQVLSTYSNRGHCEHKHAITTVHGWIKSVRRQKNVSFAVVNDGTTLRGLQAVFIQPEAEQAVLMRRLATGMSVRLTGKLIESLGKGQECELRVEEVEVLGDCEPEVIITPVFSISLSPFFTHILEISNSKEESFLGVSKGQLPSPCADVSYRCYAACSRQARARVC